MNEPAVREPIHLVMIEAHKLDKILRKARRRRRAGNIMIISGGWMLLASVMRGRRRGNDYWERATR